MKTSNVTSASDKGRSKPAPATVTTASDEPVLAAPRRNAGSLVTRFGWRLFQDDLKSGRLADLLLLGLLAMLVVNFVTAKTYLVNKDSVEVVGSKSLSKDKVVDLGLAGKSIFEVDPAAIAQQLTNSPYVRSLHVETALPNLVKVIVDERRPGVVWVVGDVPYLVEEDGSIVGTASTLDNYVVVYDRTPAPAVVTATATTSGSLATATVTSASDYREGGHLNLLATDGLDTAQRTYMLLPTIGLTINRLEYSSDTGISAVTADNQRIIIGGKDRLEAKLRICRATLDKLAGKEWLSMDLRSTVRPAVQMKVEEKPAEKKP